MKKALRDFIFYVLLFFLRARRAFSFLNTPYFWRALHAFTSFYKIWNNPRTQTFLLTNWLGLFCYVSRDYSEVECILHNNGKKIS